MKAHVKRRNQRGKGRSTILPWPPDYVLSCPGPRTTNLQGQSWHSSTCTNQDLHLHSSNEAAHCRNGVVAYRIPPTQGRSGVRSSLSTRSSLLRWHFFLCFRQDTGIRALSSERWRFWVLTELSTRIYGNMHGNKIANALSWSLLVDEPLLPLLFPGYS